MLLANEERTHYEPAQVPGERVENHPGLKDLSAIEEYVKTIRPGHS